MKEGRKESVRRGRKKREGKRRKRQEGVCVFANWVCGGCLVLNPTPQILSSSLDLTELALSYLGIQDY